MRQMSTKAGNAMHVEFRFDDVPAISVSSQLLRRILSHLGNFYMHPWVTGRTSFQ